MDILVDKKDNKTHFWVKYYLKSRTTLLDAAKELAIGQTFGNPNARSNWETDELIREFCGKILITPNVTDTNKKQGSVWIGFPYKILGQDKFRDGISQLLCILMGGQMDILNIEECNLLELEINKDLAFGQNFGLKFNKPVWKWMGQSSGWPTTLETNVPEIKGPFLGGIVKPKTGLKPYQLLDMVMELVDGGVDFIKEDEILGSPAICPLEKRVELISKYLQTAGKNILYCFCINGDADQVLKKAAFVKENGGVGVHINIWSGLGTYAAIRNTQRELYIHYQKSGDKVITSPHNKFNISWVVLCQLAGISGVDTAHVGMLGGYYGGDENVTMDAINMLKQHNVVPALSCGLTVDDIEPITKKIGHRWLANAGGSIHSDPAGTRSGAKKLRDEIDRMNAI